MDNALLINLIPTLMLTGLIWTIQIVHYPSLKFVAEDKFSDFMEFHMKNITFIVGPLMVLEVMAAVYILPFQTNILTITNLLIVVLIWLSTLFLSIPCHNKLMTHHDQEVIQRLILTNWPRTILWTLKSIILSLSTIH